MDPVAATVDRVKSLAQSSRDFVSGLLHRRNAPAPRSPIEILKRLHREAFSDLMKLRDRQDKVERILSFYKTSKGSPFQDTSTHVRGEIDVLGAILLMGDVDRQHLDALDKADIRPGMLSKFTFETPIREKDKFVAEFVAYPKGEGHSGHMSASPLSLAKVFYSACINDWFSAIAVPVGAQFRDLDAASNSFNQEINDLQALAPPLLREHQGSALGLTVRKSNIVASLAQSVSGPEGQPGLGSSSHCFSTFGKVMCQLPRRMKFSLLGLHQVPKSSSNFPCLGAIAVPMDFLRRHQSRDLTTSLAAPPLELNSREFNSLRSVALMLDAELDEYTRIGAWVEMKSSNSNLLRFAISMSENSEEDLGWGVSAGGLVESPINWAQFQVESYLKLNLGKRFCIKPGLAYVMGENARSIALMLRSKWLL